MTNSSAIVIVIAIVVVAAGTWIIFRIQKSRRLRSRFGPEYDRIVEQAGGRFRAESQLAERKKRVQRLHIRELTRDERDRFAREWLKRQSLFVEDPRSAVAQADSLITNAMNARGYPTSNFETQVADVSVDHARVVEHYRQAHVIAERGAQATT